MKLKSVAEALQCSPTLIRSWGIQQRAIGSLTPLPKRQRHSERAKADRSLPTLRETAGSGVRAGGALKHQVRLPVIKQNLFIYAGGGGECGRRDWQKMRKNAENAAKNAIENAVCLEWCLPLETPMFRLVLHDWALKAWTV